MATITMDDLIEEMLAEYEPRFIIDEPIPEAEERLLPRPLRPQWPFTDLDGHVPHPVRLPAYEPWVEILNDAKDEFEVDGAALVFSTWRVEREDPLDIGDVEITEGMHARAGRLALDARMADVRATQLLAALPGGTELLLRIKFLRGKAEDDWVLEDKFDPVRAERKKGQGVVEVSRDTKPGVLTGIDSVFYQNAYPVTAVVYGLYPVRDPDPANLAPLRDGDLNCVAQRVVEHFEGALRGQGLTPTRRHKIQEWEEKVHETGAKVDDVAELEKILKRVIILRDIAGEDILNSGKYGRGGNGGHRSIELICHNGHAWPKDLHFPQSREVHIYEGNVWHAIQGEPLAVWLQTDSSLSTSSYSRTAAPTGHERPTKDLKRSAPNWATLNLLREPSAKATRLALWQRKGTAGSQPQPTSSQTSRKPAWSTVTAASGTRWVMTRRKSLLST